METSTVELQEVEKRLRHEKNRRMYERYQTIRLYLVGTNRKQPALILGRREKTIITYKIGFNCGTSSYGYEK